MPPPGNFEIVMGWSAVGLICLLLLAIVILERRK